MHRNDCGHTARKSRNILASFLVAAIAAAIVFSGSRLVRAQAPAPTVGDPNLAVRTVVSGLDTSISIAFIGTNDLLVLEKNTGKVKQVTNGVVQGTVLDLAVNNASERGLAWPTTILNSTSWKVRACCSAPISESQLTSKPDQTATCSSSRSRTEQSTRFTGRECLTTAIA